MHVRKSNMKNINVVFTLLCLASTFKSCSSGKSVQKTTVKSDLLELSAYNISSNLMDWETDMAIMFYAPWCKYCKQMTPIMESIATLVSSNKNLIIGQFDCDLSSAHTDMCASLKINRYPSIYFMGYGNFNQAADGKLFDTSRWTKKKLDPRIVTFNSDLYPEAIYDWIKLLSTISYVQRRWDDLKGAFTGRLRSSVRIQAMKQQLAAAEQKAILFGRELEKYKADEMFDSLPDNGDPFPLVNSLDPDEVRSIAVPPIMLKVL